MEYPKMSNTENKVKEYTSIEADKGGTPDIQSDLMIAIFQAAYPIWNDVKKEDEEDQTVYVKALATDIKRLGRMFKFLGLAEDDKQSVLGWKPTAKLIRMVAERAARPTKGSNKRATRKDDAMMQSLLQVADGWVEQTFTDDFVFNVLNCFGLLRENIYGECKPTAPLRDMLQEIFQA
jgi:hypothetical protein